MMHGQTNIR